MSHSSSQIFTPFPLAPQVISRFDSNGATEIGRLDAPDDTLDLNRRFMSHSSTHLRLVQLSMACNLEMGIRLRLLVHLNSR